VPWYLTLIPTIKELINPPKLPPLEVTSKPVEVKDQWGLYRGNETKAGVSSLLIHAGAIALLVFVGSLKPVQNLVKEQIALIAPDLKPYIPKQTKASGGGGGGARAPLEASKGKLPKPAPRQFTPPRVDPLENPKLPMPPSLIAPELPTLNAQNFGDPLSNMRVSSNGLGLGGGIGSGSGGGVGSGKGPGVGPGSGGGFGGGAYRIGGGVSQPTLLSKVEPEYSEEARKAKWQGTVVLSLIVDASGLAQEIKVVRSLGMGLDQKAIEAVQKWKFRPGMKDGKAVPVYATVEVNFRLL
jgi:TonB family protein